MSIVNYNEIDCTDWMLIYKTAISEFYSHIPIKCIVEKSLCYSCSNMDFYSRLKKRWAHFMFLVSRYLEGPGPYYYSWENWDEQIAEIIHGWMH